MNTHILYRVSENFQSVGPIISSYVTEPFRGRPYNLLPKLGHFESKGEVTAWEPKIAGRVTQS